MAFWVFLAFHFGLLGFHFLSFLSFWPFWGMVFWGFISFHPMAHQTWRKSRKTANGQTFELSSCHFLAL